MNKTPIKSQKNCLTAEKITQIYEQDEKRNIVLKDLDATFKQGSSYAITGASGSGKSTLLHILGGLDKPTYGTVTFENSDIFDMDEQSTNNFRSRSIGFMFQFHYLIPELSALQNVVIAGIIRGHQNKEATKHAEKLLTEFGIKQQHLLPHQMSGGQQQRVALARALMNKPTFLLADEPTGNLDGQNAEKITNLLIQYKEKWNMGLIICTHDKTICKKMDTILNLEDGHLTNVTGAKL
ncbi:ABC transporter ATP-binding protein [Candidatus Babeliales bacterium]|nr:ABC transporter ATP-binding protein [Candidatus Babeliales bacterium]